MLSPWKSILAPGSNGLLIDIYFFLLGKWLSVADGNATKRLAPVGRRFREIAAFAAGKRGALL